MTSPCDSRTEPSRSAAAGAWMPAPETPAQAAFVRGFDFEDPNLPALIELRRRYALDAVVRGDGPDIERFRRLSNWTYARFGMFGRPTVTCEHAGEVLAHAETGHTFYCAHYAIVMCAAATALGWPARVLSLRRADYPGRVSNHNVVELWSASFGKWVFWDPTLNFALFLGGAPLHALEAAQAFFGSERERLEIQIGPEPRRARMADLPIPYRTYPGFGLQRLDERGLSSLACLAHLPTNRLMGAYAKRSIERWEDWPGLEPILVHALSAPDAQPPAPYYPMRQG